MKRSHLWRVWSVLSCGAILLLGGLQLDAGSARAAAVLPGTISEYSTPTPTSYPYKAVKGPDGNVWFTEITANQIGMITPSGQITEYAAGVGSNPEGITAGSDGALWFAEAGTNNIGRMTTSGQLTEYQLPTPGSYPEEIITAPDGSFWFTESQTARIGHMSATGVFEGEYQATAGSVPEGLVFGNDGNIWFTEDVGNAIGRLAPSTGAISEFPVPTADSGPASIVNGFQDGNLWFTEADAGRVASINYLGQFGASYSPGGHPVGIIQGTDSALWIAQQNGHIGRIVGSTGSLTEYSVPGGGQPTGIVQDANNNIEVTLYSTPKIAILNTGNAQFQQQFKVRPGHNTGMQGLTSGPDGALWFTQSATSRIGRATTSGQTSVISLAAGSTPTSITAGANNTLWYTDAGSNKIGSVTTSGQVTEYTVPTANSAPADIVAGSGSVFWFTENNTNKIGSITTAGQITEYATRSYTSYPRGIVIGPDGNPWFTEKTSIGTINASGVITEYPVAGAGQLFSITSGPDGALWFTDYAANMIGRITTSGTVTEYTLPTSNSAPTSITSGPDGNLWFTENNAHQVGFITISGQISEYPTMRQVGTNPYTIAVGPDHNLWFTEMGADGLGSIAPN